MAKLTEPEKLLRIWIDTVKQGEPVILDGTKMKVIFGPWDRRFAVIGPKGMTPAQVKKVHDAVVAAFNDPGVKETMAKQGNAISITSTERAQKGFRAELAKYAALVKKAGIEPQ